MFCICKILSVNKPWLLLLLKQFISCTFALFMHLKVTDNDTGHNVSRMPTPHPPITKLLQYLSICINELYFAKTWSLNVVEFLTLRVLRLFSIFSAKKVLVKHRINKFKDSTCYKQPLNLYSWAYSIELNITMKYLWNYFLVSTGYHHDWKEQVALNGYPFARFFFGNKYPLQKRVKDWILKWPCRPG